MRSFPSTLVSPAAAVGIINLISYLYPVVICTPFALTSHRSAIVLSLTPVAVVIVVSWSSSYTKEAPNSQKIAELVASVCATAASLVSAAHPTAVSSAFPTLGTIWIFPKLALTLESCVVLFVTTSPDAPLVGGVNLELPFIHAPVVPKLPIPSLIIYLVNWVKLPALVLLNSPSDILTAPSATKKQGLELESIVSICKSAAEVPSVPFTWLPRLRVVSTCPLTILVIRPLYCKSIPVASDNWLSASPPISRGSEWLFKPPSNWFNDIDALGI